MLQHRHIGNYIENVIKTFLFYAKCKIMKLLHHSFEKIAFLFVHTEKKLKLLKLNKNFNYEKSINNFHSMSWMFNKGNVLF